MSEKHVAKITAASFMAVITSAAFVFMHKNTISEWTFIATLAFSLGVFFAISSTGDFVLFRFWNMELKFRKMQQTEESIKELGKAIHDVVETHSHALMLESFDSESANAAMANLKSLIDK